MKDVLKGPEGRYNFILVPGTVPQRYIPTPDRGGNFYIEAENVQNSDLEADYIVAVVPSKEKKTDLVTMQNNFYQTPDEYNIRFYMYDYNVMCFRLLGYQTVGAKPMGS